MLARTLPPSVFARRRRALMERMGSGSVALLPAAPPAPRMRSMPVTVGGFRIGQQVSHPKCGGGVIVQAEGSGNDARVQVNFRNEGLKWLALEYAKLSPA